MSYRLHVDECVRWVYTCRHTRQAVHRVRSQIININYIEVEFIHLDILYSVYIVACIMLGAELGCVLETSHP